MGNAFIEFALSREAHTARVVSNVLGYSTVAPANEAPMLGPKSGLGPGILHKALMESAPTKARESFSPHIIAGKHAPRP